MNFPTESHAETWSTDFAHIPVLIKTVCSSRSWIDITTKGNFPMKRNNMLFLALIKRKNKMIRLEREQRRALEETVSVLSAYVGLLLARIGGCEIPVALVKEAIGGYSFKIGKSGDCYTVEAVKCAQNVDEKAAESIKLASDGGVGQKRDGATYGDGQI